MARLTSFLVLVCLLLVAPALCVGGVLEHACECGQGGEVQCPHEQSCSVDPCVTFARVQKQDLGTAPGVEAPSVPVAPLPWYVAPSADPRSWSPQVFLAPSRQNLPYAPAERPLRR